MNSRMDMAEQTRMANEFRREAVNEYGIGSSYRIHEYIQLRLKGVTSMRAWRIVRSKDGKGKS